MALVQRPFSKLGRPTFLPARGWAARNFLTRAERANGRADSERRAFLRLHSPKHTMVASSDASTTFAVVYGTTST